jgi:hypothetical protein
MFNSILVYGQDNNNNTAIIGIKQTNTSLTISDNSQDRSQKEKHSLNFLQNSLA